jgi:hypothetical protein
MNLALSSGRLIELVAAVLILAAGIYFYRRREPKDGSQGGQGAVIMFAVAAIMGIHALGGLDYHPTAAEADYFKAKAH